MSLPAREALMGATSRGERSILGLVWKSHQIEDRRGDDQQAEDLVAPEGAPLFGAPLVFGDLLLIRLDAAFDHECFLRRTAMRDGSPRISIGGLR